jgi:glycosyltransferase involved in cell wall biosynthesis
VLTHNERRNLPACLASVEEHVAAIHVVDSFSSDETLDIARAHGCAVVQRRWLNYADQFQWALDHLPIDTEWVLRLDADERWTPEGFAELAGCLSDPGVDGINVRMKIFFMGRWMRHGALYPNDFLRVFRRGRAAIEQRWMDEHVRVAGRTVTTTIDVVESNYDRQENLGLWTTKHNGYSTREAVDFLVLAHGLAKLDSVADLRGGRTARKRWLKERVYLKMPLFLRPFLYFAYRYFLKLGFLDGVPGFVFHVLQGFWYRFLVDAKIYQLELQARRTGRSVREVIQETYGISP